MVSSIIYILFLLNFIHDKIPSHNKYIYSSFSFSYEYSRECAFIKIVL